MTFEYRSFGDRKPREPTFIEKKIALERAAAGVDDVYRDIEQAPQEFWQALLQATYWAVMNSSNFGGEYGKKWWDEFRFQHGWPELHAGERKEAFEKLLLHGLVPGVVGGLGEGYRLAAIEVLLDLVRKAFPTQGPEKFADLANEAATRFRVGIRLEGSRFVDVTSEEVHQEVVRPALALLADARFKQAETLYRKGYERLFAGDPAGSITAATSAVQEMLTIGGAKGSSLQPLARNARAASWIGPGEEQQIIKLEAFRGDADAHKVGTDDEELARLVLHLCAGILLYLGRTMPELEMPGPPEIQEGSEPS